MSVSEKVRKTPLGVMCIECPFRALSKPPAMPVVMTQKNQPRWKAQEQSGIEAFSPSPIYRAFFF